MKQLQKCNMNCRGGRASLQTLLVLYAEFIVCVAIVMERRKQNGEIMVIRVFIVFFPYMIIDDVYSTKINSSKRKKLIGPATIMILLLEAQCGINMT